MTTAEEDFCQIWLLRFKISPERLKNTKNISLAMTDIPAQIHAGNGTIISPHGHILTAAHLIIDCDDDYNCVAIILKLEDGPQQIIWWSPEHNYRLQVIKIWPEYDLALLKMDLPWDNKYRPIGTELLCEEQLPKIYGMAFNIKTAPWKKIDVLQIGFSVANDSEPKRFRIFHPFFLREDYLQLLPNIKNNQQRLSAGLSGSPLINGRLEVIGVLSRVHLVKKPDYLQYTPFIQELAEKYPWEPWEDQPNYEFFLIQMLEDSILEELNHLLATA